MNKTSSADYSRDDIKRLLLRIPFFSDVNNAAADQFEALIDVAEIVEAAPGETVIQKGATDMFMYFLLKGQLAVHLQDEPSSQAVNYISPGEVFGILSMITHTPRSAFIKADENARETLLYKLNFSYLNDDSPVSRLGLATKLVFFRMALHNIRWTLETNKMTNPNHPLVAEIRKIPMIKAQKDTPEELAALKDQAMALSQILFKWNESSE